MRITEEQRKEMQRRFALQSQAEEGRSIPRYFHRTWSHETKNNCNLSRFKEEFYDQDVHILAGGVSLYGIDWDRFKDRKTICVNNTIKWFTHPSVHLFLDMPVLLEGGRTDGVPIITRVGNNVPTDKGEVYHLKCANRITLDPERNGFFSHYSTVHVAISLALFAQAKRVFLWGVEQMFMNDEQFKTLSDFQWLCDWYKKKDILKVYNKMKKNGQCFGHFYSHAMPHKRDGVERPYKNARHGLNDFMQHVHRMPIFNMSPVHNTPFPFLHPDEAKI